MLIGLGDQALDALAFPSINGNTNAGGQGRLLLVLRHNGMNAFGDTIGLLLLGFGKYKGEFVAAIAGSGVNGAAVDAKVVRNAADGAAADKVAVSVVNLFEAVEIEKQKSEGAAAAIGALRFVFKNVEETAIVGEAGERIADSEMADLFEEAGVIE